MKLYHFTCDHGYEALGTRGYLEPPVTHPLLGCKVIWLTTEGTPDREKTGLTMERITCDRMAFRYIVVEHDLCYPWLGSDERAASPARYLDDLERYGDPDHWWITPGPTLARLG